MVAFVGGSTCHRAEQIRPTFSYSIPRQPDQQCFACSLLFAYRNEYAVLSPPKGEVLVCIGGELGFNYHLVVPIQIYSSLAV